MAHIDRWSPNPSPKTPDAWRAMLVEIESASVLVGDNRRMGKE
jgi:hypothetical protein